MTTDGEDLFRQLAEDEAFQAAHAAHEAAFQTKECPICRFFNAVHEIRHFAEAADAEKILGLAGSTQEFLDDAMVISQFFMEATRWFLQDPEFWADEEYEEEVEYEEGDDDDA